jgi:hypothetical protein
VRCGLVLLVWVAIAAAPGSAHAGRTFYGWLHSTDVMPERGVELQTWISDESKIEEEANRSETTWGVGPFVGITDQLELGLPLEVLWFGTPGVGGGTALYDYGAELRYRLVTQDPEDAPAFAPLVRLAVNRLVLFRDTVQPELDIVGTRDEHHFELRPGVGVSFNVVDDFRVGAEVFAQISLDDDGSSWAIAGPNLSWTHGRFWVSAVYGIGFYRIKDAPRMQWGIAF